MAPQFGFIASDRHVADRALVLDGSLRFRVVNGFAADAALPVRIAGGVGHDAGAPVETDGDVLALGCSEPVVTGQAAVGGMKRHPRRIISRTATQRLAQPRS